MKCYGHKYSPTLDYGTIVKAAQLLCNSPSVGREMFARAMFNLFACNQDDHSKNWSFLMDDKGDWFPTPFYDVTFSPSPYHEHSTAFLGYGKNPPVKTIIELARQANLSRKDAGRIIEQITEVVFQWEDIATEVGVSKKTKNMIQKVLNFTYKNNAHLCSLA